MSSNSLKACNDIHLPTLRIWRYVLKLKWALVNLTAYWIAFRLLGQAQRPFTTSSLYSSSFWTLSPVGAYIPDTRNDLLFPKSGRLYASKLMLVLLHGTLIFFFLVGELCQDLAQMFPSLKKPSLITTLLCLSVLPLLHPTMINYTSSSHWDYYMSLN